MSKFCLNIDYLDEPKKKTQIEKVLSEKSFHQKREFLSINVLLENSFFFIYSTKYGQIHIWLKNERLKQSVYSVI